MSYEERPTDRLDLGGTKARKKALEANAVNWRLDSSNKLPDAEAIFKIALGKSKSVGSNYYEPRYNKSNVRVYPERDNASSQSKKDRRLYHQQ